MTFQLNSLAMIFSLRIVGHRHKRRFLWSLQYGIFKCLFTFGVLKIVTDHKDEFQKNYNDPNKFTQFIKK